MKTATIFSAILFSMTAGLALANPEPKAPKIKLPKGSKGSGSGSSCTSITSVDSAGFTTLVPNADCTGSASGAMPTGMVDPKMLMGMVGAAGAVAAAAL